MHNQNDIDVEMKIAQERYQPIIQAQQLERATADDDLAASSSHRVRTWLANLLIRWGQQLQKHDEPMPERSLNCS